MPKPLPFLVAACCAGAALPAAAGAAEVDYRVTYDVTITHTRTASSATASPVTRSDSRTALSTHLTGDYGTISFRDGRLSSGADHMPVRNANSGTFDGSSFKQDWYDDQRHCTAADRTGFQGHGKLDTAFLPSLTGESLVARLSDRSATEWDCTGVGATAPAPDTGWSTDAELGAGPLDASFDLPFEAIGTGKILQRVSGPSTAAGDFCPGKDDDTSGCSSTWEGWITFEKTAERGGGAAGQTTPAVQPPATTPGPRTGTPAPAAPTAPRRATVDARGRVTFTATCPAGCGGTLRVKAGRTIARKRFVVAAGGVQTVRVALPAKARKALRRARRGTATVVLTPPAGQPLTTELGLRARTRR